ncbi:hypothetical protein ABPG74_004246 [Tetrahymena malaccensis]
MSLRSPSLNLRNTSNGYYNKYNGSVLSNNSINSMNGNNPFYNTDKQTNYTSRQLSASNNNHLATSGNGNYFLSLRNIPYCTKPKHQSEKIIRVCVQPECNDLDRLLCGHCIIYHATHPAKLISIQEFVEKCSLRHKEVNLNQLSENSVEEQLVNQIENRFQKIREEFYAFLMEQQVALISRFRNILGFSRDFNLSYLQEIEGKNIQDLTKPEWDLIINLYWKDDIDNALAVKDECIRQVSENIKKNFDIIEAVSKDNQNHILGEVNQMMKMAQEEVKRKNAPVNMNNLDQWNKNYERRILLEDKNMNIRKIEDELARLNRQLQEQKDGLEQLQMEILKHDNRLKEIKEKESYIKYELEKLQSGNTPSGRDEVEQLKDELSEIQKKIDLVTQHTQEYQNEMNRKIENLKKRRNELKQALATDFTQAGEADKQQQLDKIDQEIQKTQQGLTKTKKQLDSERGSLLLQREDMMKDLERKQQSKDQQIIQLKQEKQKLYDERMRIDGALDSLRKKLVQKEGSLRDLKSEVKKKEWIVIQEKAESEQLQIDMKQIEDNTSTDYNTDSTAGYM